MKKLIKITFVAAGISIFYIALAFILSVTNTGFFLRTWVDALGKVMIALVLPLLLIGMLVLWVRQRERIHSVIKGIFALAAGAAYLVWAYLAVLFIVFSMQEERMIAPGLLVTNEAAFLQESKYVYYRPAALLFKIPAELTDEVKIKYLEKKYDREFMTDVSENGYLCDRELPDVKVSVYRNNMELNDDYVQQMALKYLTEGYQALGVTRACHISERYDGSNLLYMEFDGEADIPALAADVSGMISYCMTHTDLFEEHGGYVGVSSDHGGHEITFSLPFGKIGGWDKEEDLAEVMAERYAYYAELSAQSDERAQQLSGVTDGEKMPETVLADDQTQQLGESETVHAEAPQDYVEEDAKALYDAVLADEGFSYNVHYNAKGNFTVELGEKDGYHYSLVYDHPSKNGACELFVLYKSTEEGADNDIIVDMYAVENATKKVVASGRKHWSDVGTKEYREMTEREIMPEM